jgi:hypothetical protein
MRFIYFFASLCIFSGDAPALPTLKSIPMHHVLKATFTQQRYLKDIPRPIQSKGELLLWNGKGVLWKTQEPFPNTILLTTKGLFQGEKGQRISLMGATQGGQESTLFEMLSKILSGSFSELTAFTISSSPSSHGKWKLTLTPTQSSLKEFIASIETEGDQYISHLIIYRTNGDRDDILIKNQTIIKSHVLSSEEKSAFDE